MGIQDKQHISELKTMRWRMKHLSSSNSHLPALPGLYAIGHEENVHGLEMARFFAYVGQTVNLRQRMNKHMPEKETNEPLSKYLRDNFAHAKCWYTVDVDAAREQVRLKRALSRKLFRGPGGTLGIPEKQHISEMKTMRWRMKHLSSSNFHLPALPGLYAIGHEEEVYGLVIFRSYVYVGQTVNLRRRMNEHVPENEMNEPLRKYLRDNFAHAKCWYTIDVDAERERIRFERALIGKLSLQFNRK